MKAKYLRIVNEPSTATLTDTSNSNSSETISSSLEGIWVWDATPRRCLRCRMYKDEKCLKRKKPEDCRKSYALKRK
jgi:hypothetical protein